MTIPQSMRPTRTVTPMLTISFGGIELDLSKVPGIASGDKVSVLSITAEVIQVDVTDLMQRHIVSPVEFNEAGFRKDAVLIGGLTP